MSFVKISKDLTSWAWINDSKTVYIYVRLLLGAAWTETDFRNVHLKRGQIAISQREFAEKCGVTYQELRTILQRLISTHKITQETTQRMTVITLLEYDCQTQPSTQSPTTYQRNDNAIITQKQRNDNASTLLYKEDKNIREEVASEEAGSASPTAASITRESLIEIFGEDNVNEYEKRYDNWKASKGGKVRGDRYTTIRRMMEEDGVGKPDSHSSIDKDAVWQRIMQRYRNPA